MLFIETSLFTRDIADYLSDDEYTGLQALLMEHPDAGVIVPGSGGVRKLRWAVSGRGKRGGIRNLSEIKGVTLLLHETVRQHGEGW